MPECSKKSLTIRTPIAKSDARMSLPTLNYIAAMSFSLFFLFRSRADGGYQVQTTVALIASARTRAAPLNTKVSTK